MIIKLKPINDDNRDAVSEAADEAMNDIACEIYKNAKG